MNDTVHHLNEIANYWRERCTEQESLIGALIYSRGYANGIATYITERCDELIASGRDVTELRRLLESLNTVLNVPTDKVVAWQRDKDAEFRREADRG